MQEICFTIPLNPVTKKNSQRILKTRDGRSFIAPSAKYKDYEKQAGRYLPKLESPLSDPVEVKAVFYMATRRKVDLTNLLEALDDILVKYGVLEDDNYTILASHDKSRVYHDKENPRTEVTITKL